MVRRQMVWVQIITEEGAVTDQNYGNPSNEASLCMTNNIFHTENKRYEEKYNSSGFTTLLDSK